jgi:hypothetical protein
MQSGFVAVQAHWLAAGYRSGHDTVFRRKGSRRDVVIGARDLLNRKLGARSVEPQECGGAQPQTAAQHVESIGGGLVDLVHA